jgi:subtilase family serine protease
MSNERRRRMRPGRALVAVTTLFAMSAAVIAGGPLDEPAGAASAAIRVGSAPVLPKRAITLGALRASTPITVDVVLQPRNPAALAAFANAVSTPGSSLYRHFLPPGEFPAVFGPSSATIESVARWLRSQGLRPSSISSDHLYFQVSATAGLLEHAFSISLVRFDLGSRIVYANTAGPLFAGAIAGAIQGVVGLSDIDLPHHQSMFPIRRLVRPHNSPYVVTGGPQPCSAAMSVAEENGAYTADQIASAYQFSSLYAAGDLGAGQTVAIFELEPDRTSDIRAYQSCYGTDAAVTYIKVDGGAGSGAGSGEAALDIENVIGLAPQAAIDVYQAPNSDAGLYDDYSEIVSQDKAKVVSTSWGACEAESGDTVLNEENTLFEDAATQGQSVFAASGDNGSEDCYSNALAVDDPASQPYVTGVGGTSLADIGPPPTETVWNDRAIRDGAGGGGISSRWPMPSYQSIAPSSLDVINSDSSGAPCGAAAGSYCREVPDVSADADPYTGYVIYFRGSWSPVGGTSAAAPLWAALMALTNASSGCAATPIGFANPALYRVAESSSYSTSFSDITVGNNQYRGSNGGKFPATTGYDMASGLGTPIASGLSTALCAGPTNTVTVTDPERQKTVVGTSVSLQIEATDSGGLSLTYTSSVLPHGLELNDASGLITGKPETPVSSRVTVTATDPTGASASATFTWRVVDP